MKIAAGILLLSLACGSSQVLYNIDFNSQATGTVQTGAPPSFVSRIVGGPPTVVSSYASLMNQPLAMRVNATSPTYAGVQLDFTQPQNQLSLSFDFSAGALGGAEFLTSFGVTSNLYAFSANFEAGGIAADWGGRTNSRSGTFTNGEGMHMDITINTSQNHAWMWKNGVLISDVTLGQPQAVNYIEFELDAAFTPPNIPASAGIDNIIVAVPESGTLPLIAALAAVATTAARRRSA